MSETQRNDDFQKKLNDSEAKAIESANKRIDMESSWAERNEMKDLDPYPQLKAIYRTKAEELTRELLKLYDDRGLSKEEKERNKQTLLLVQDVVLRPLAQRLDLTLRTFGKDNKGAASEELRSRGMAFLVEASVPSLIYEHLKKHGREDLARKYESMVKDKAELAVPDMTETLDRVNKGEITEKDWELILDKVKILREKDPDWVEKGAATALIGAIPINKRPLLLQKMLEWEDFGSLTQTLTVSGYVTTAQVISVVSTQIGVLEAQLAASKPRDKEKVEGRISSLKGVLAQIQDPEVAKAQEQMEQAKHEVVKKRQRSGQFGQFNSARQMLTFKGIFGTLLAANGVATMFANALMHIKEPSKILENPAIKYGAGMAIVGIEMNNGFGNMMDTSREDLAQLLSRQDERTEEKLKSQAAFEREVGRYDKAAKLYVQYADIITIAYNKKRQKQLTSKVEMTMEEMGIDWDKLPAEFKSQDKRQMESVLSRWVSRMGGGSTSERLSADTQIAFIQDNSRKKYGVPPYEVWSAKKKEEAKLKQ